MARGAIVEVAPRLPRYGVTAFCPDVDCLRARRRWRRCCGRVRRVATRAVQIALVFCRRISRATSSIPITTARSPADACGYTVSRFRGSQGSSVPRFTITIGQFTGADILSVIATHREQVGIVTLAPELDGGMELVRQLAAAGHRVSIGHTGATYEKRWPPSTRGLARHPSLQPDDADDASRARRPGGCAAIGAGARRK